MAYIDKESDNRNILLILVILGFILLAFFFLILPQFQDVNITPDNPDNTEVNIEQREVPTSIPLPSATATPTEAPASPSASEGGDR